MATLPITRPTKPPTCPEIIVNIEEKTYYIMFRIVVIKDANKTLEMVTNNVNVWQRLRLIFKKYQSTIPAGL